MTQPTHQPPNTPNAPAPTAFPFTKKRIDVLGASMAYVDEGSGDPILFLHGNPTSSYLWRNIIPHVSGLGRCIAPDLIGMGDSEKIDSEYRFVDHARYVDGFIEALGLDRVTLVLHDWGSALGFAWAMRHPERVRALAFMEAILMPLPSWDVFPPPQRDLFVAICTPGVGEDLVLERNVFVEQILPGAVLAGLAPEAMAAYRAPFPDPASRRPVLAWPRQIPVAGQPADVVATVNAYRDALTQSKLPKLMFAATPGAIGTADTVAWCRANLPALEIIDLGAGVHYLQEDHPDAIGHGLAAFVRRLG